MAKNTKKTEPKKRAYAEFKEKNKLPPLWKGDAAIPKADEHSETSLNAESSGSSTTRVSENEGSSTFRFSEDSGSSTSRTLETSSSSEKTDFSQVQFNLEKWEENLLALNRGEKSSLRARGPHNREVPRAKDIFQPEREKVEADISGLITLMSDQKTMQTIKQDPSKLRKFFSKAEDCAKKGVTLEINGAKELLSAVQDTKKAYKEEISTLAAQQRRERFAREGRQKAEIHEDSHRPKKR